MIFKITDDQQWLVVQESTTLEYRQLESWLNRYVKDYKFHPKVKARVWDGRVFNFKNGKIRIGLWKEIKLCCEKYGFDFVISNKELFPYNKTVSYDMVNNFCIDFFKNHKSKDDINTSFFPHDHQLKEAYKLIKSRYSITEVATSGGKTLMMSIIIFYIIKNLNPNAKFLIIVPSTNLVTQTYNEIHSYNLGYHNENKTPLDIRIDEIMSETPRKIIGIEPNIYIGTFQSLEKWPKEFFKQFQGIIVDEGHKSQCKSIQKILEHCYDADYRIGISGTFYNVMSSEWLVVQKYLGPKVGQIRADELIEKGIVTPVNIKAIMINHNDPSMYESTKTLRAINKGKESFDLETAYIKASKLREDFIINIMKKVTKNSLVLFKTISYGTTIYERCCNEIPGIEFFYIDGEIDNKKRDAIKIQLEKEHDKPRVLIASYGTLSTGVSINQLMNLFFIESYKSEIIIRQSIGRVLRKHSKKERANVFDFVDVFLDPDQHKPSNSLYKHYLERKKIYDEQNFPNQILKVNLQ